MKTSKILLAALLIGGLFGSAFADHHKKGGQSLFQQTFLATYAGETDKMVSLAEAFTAEGMEWRPAEGVRSVREAILHVAGANYGLGARFLGKEMPEGINPRQFNKTIKSKEDTIKVLKDSIQFVKEAVGSLDEASLAESIKLFGNDSSKMGAVLVLGGHAYEHLGQLIAYARSSGVVPPWSM